MKKVAISLCMIVILYHGSLFTMHRSLIRLGASSMMATMAALLYHYNCGLKATQQELNPLDHEVIVQFYLNNHEAKNSLYQTLKDEAMNGKTNWFDRYFSDTIRHDGLANSHITLASESPNTQCWFKYDYDTESGQHVPFWYDCSTCLDHEQFKRHIAQGISEGRIKSIKKD